MKLGLEMRMNRRGMIRMMRIQNKYIKKIDNSESGMKAYSFCSTHLKYQKHLNDMVYPSNDSGMRTSNYNIRQNAIPNMLISKWFPQKTLLNNANEERKTRANHKVNQLTYDAAF